MCRCTRHHQKKDREGEGCIKARSDSSTSVDGSTSTNREPNDGAAWIKHILFGIGISIFLFRLFIHINSYYYYDHRNHPPPNFHFSDDVSSSTSTTSLANISQSILEDAELRAKRVFDKVDTKVEEALTDLFNSLDKNGDGTIDRNEFEGMTLSSWAVWHAFSSSIHSTASFWTARPSLNKLRETLGGLLSLRGEAEASSGFFANVSRWTLRFLEMQCMIHLFLFVLENARHYLGFRRSGWRFPSRSERVKPSDVAKMSKADALRYTTPLQGYELYKMWFMTLTGIALFRFVCFAFSVICGVVFVNIAAVVPNKLWRDFWLLGPTRIACFVLMTFLGYYRIDIHGRLADKSECKLLVPNHVGAVEIFVLYGIAFPSFVSALVNTRLPLFGAICKVSDAILVDRSDPDSRKHTLREIKQRVADPTGEQLMVFPEGTTESQEALFRFSRGVFLAKAPVQLVAFKMPYRNFNPSYTGRAVGGCELVDLLWRSFCQVVQRMEVKFIPVHKPTKAEEDDATLYANNMQRVLASHLGIGISDATYSDYRKVERAYKARKVSAIAKARKLRRENKNGCGDRWWNPFSSCLMCFPGQGTEPQSIRIDLDAFDFDASDSSPAGGGAKRE